MGIIDFRIRPPFGIYQKFTDFITEEKISGYGFKYEGSIKTNSLEDLIQELDSAGVEKAVVPGRDGEADNNELFELAEKYNNRFIIFPYIDPLQKQKALDEIDELIINGKGKGVAVEPGGFMSTYYRIDDALLYPFYKKLEDNNIPILLTYSSFVFEVMDIHAPARLDRIAHDFPNLTIVVAHGGWPWVREVIAIAAMRKNVYIIPDIYGTRGPGAEDYITAAKTILQDKIIFGSSFPIAPFSQVYEFVRDEWKLTEEQKEKVFYKNAAKILGLE